MKNMAPHAAAPNAANASSSFFLAALWSASEPRSGDMAMITTMAMVLASARRALPWPSGSPALATCTK
jgi:hypothetical protein